ncbi:MAG: NEAT domain-containing protein [Clostridia bacterium]|nr:NEAT domain-containing protein [Clostridia bacterium]
MKKVLSIVIALFILMSVSICASAAEFSNGTYEVPVVLMHKEDEKESFGNKYVAQTALLEVKSGKKTITIPLTTDMKGIEFSYYTNGSLTGNVNKGKSVSNVTVAGKNYKQGFEIPIMADGDIGLQFSVPVMPMSPSARLRIDYGKAVLITSDEITTDTSQIETTTQIPATELLTQVPETTTEVETTEATTHAVEQSATVQEETTVYVNEIPDDKSDEEKNEAISSVFFALFSSVVITYIIPVLLIVIIFIVGAVTIKRFVKSKKQKEKNNNDDK